MNMSLIEISRQAFNSVHINSLCKIAQTKKFQKRALILMKTYWYLETKQPKTLEQMQTLQVGYSKLDERLKKLIDDYQK